MIIFNPSKFALLVLGKDFFKKKILTSEMELKKFIMSAILKASYLTKREVNATVYKVVDKYEKKMKYLKAEGIKAFKSEALNNEVLLKDRIENLVIWNEVQNLKEEHEGEYYRWLPSSAETPDPEHQLLYGKIFKVGEGDKEGNMPAERYGCKCGMQILTAEEAKDLKGRIKHGI